MVQKVQPNDKSGKLLPNNHTQGRKRAPGHLMSKGLRAASRQTKGEPWQSRSLRIGGGRRLRSPPYRTCDGVAGSAPESLSPHLKFFLQKRLPQKGYPLSGQKPFLDRFLEQGPKPILKIQKSPPRGGLAGKLNNLNRGGGACPRRRGSAGGPQPHASIVFLLPKFVCDALDRASSDAERLGNLQYGVRPWGRTG